MRKSLLSAVAAASLFALPAFAADQLSSDPEIRVQQEWQLLVAKTQGVTATNEAALPAHSVAVSDQLSSDPEIRVQQEWERLVAKTNADREAATALGDVAAVKSATATDARQTTRQIDNQTRYVGPAPAVGAGGRYNTTQDYWQDR